MSGVENGNGDLTREVLRAEIRAARAEDKLEFLGELDKRLTPINNHLASMDGGQFSDGMRAGIVAVVAADHAVSMQSTSTRWSIRSSKVALISAAVLFIGLCVNTAIALAALSASGTHHP